MRWGAEGVACLCARRHDLGRLPARHLRSPAGGAGAARARRGRGAGAAAGWHVYNWVTSSPVFEAFIMGNILLIGVATGIDLENRDGDPGVQRFVNMVT